VIIEVDVVVLLFAEYAKQLDFSTLCDQEQVNYYEKVICLEI